MNRELICKYVGGDSAFDERVINRCEGLKLNVECVNATHIDIASIFDDTNIIIIDIASNGKLMEKLDKHYNSKNNVIIGLVDNCENRGLWLFYSKNIITATLKDLDRAMLSAAKIPMPRCVCDAVDIDAVEVYRLSTEVIDWYKISTKLNGYNMIKESVNIVIQHSGHNVVYSVQVYPVVAQIFHKTVSNVEKSIRIAITKAIKQNPSLFSVNVFGNGKISNVIFINHIAEMVKLKYLAEKRKKAKKDKHNKKDPRI